jgi:CBS domain-containing protein
VQTCCSANGTRLEKDCLNQKNRANLRGSHGRETGHVRKDVMTPHVVSVRPDESVSVAARLMLRKKISGLLVVNDLENIVGVVSESDFLRRTEIGTKRQRSRCVEFFMGPGRLADE